MTKTITFTVTLLRTKWFLSVSLLFSDFRAKAFFAIHEEANFFLQNIGKPIQSTLSFVVGWLLACQFIKIPEEDKSWFVGCWSGSQENLHDLESTVS